MLFKGSSQLYTDAVHGRGLSVRCASVLASGMNIIPHINSFYNFWVMEFFLGCCAGIAFKIVDMPTISMRGPAPKSTYMELV